MESQIFCSDPLLMEIGAIVMHAVDEGRSELNAEETEYITRFTQRMVKETKTQLGEIAHLLPEKMPEEIVDEILRKNRGFNYGV